MSMESRSEILEKKKIKLLNEKWKNRRRMAWVSLYSILIVTILALYSVPMERLVVLEQIITWFYFVLGSIIGAYVGFSTLEEMKPTNTKR